MNDHVAILHAAGVNFSYRHSKQQLEIFSQLDVSIETAQFVSIVGPSGCGKSTLLRMFMGLQRVSSGEVRIEGKVIEEPSRDIGMVFQRDSLLPWRTALRNVALGLEGRMPKEEAARRAADSLERVGLESFASAYPAQLSGGMRQRVNLARALALSPKVILMDEPFAALDSQTRERLQEHLTDVWDRDRKTVVFVTHQLDEAVFLSDRVILLGRPPTGIVEDCDITLQRPRSHAVKRSPEFRDIVDRLTERLEGLSLTDANVVQ